MTELNHMNMPPGWDSKYDQKTGKSYFFNHLTKNVSLDDPRIRFKQLQCEDIPLLSMQKQGLSRSKGGHLYQDCSNSSGHPSPLPSYRSFGHSPALSQRSYSPTLTTQDYSSSTQQLDDSVLKLCSIFPTVDESHVRALLIKYHNREALVISALQVEKHPLCTPGPYTPPPLRLRRYNLGPLSSSVMSSPSSSPRPPGSTGPGIWRSSPHSPKMKLRYLKSVFPVVDDTVLLDTLSASDNNVNKATDNLLNQGFSKYSKTSPPRVTLATLDGEGNGDTGCTLPRMKTPEEKDAMKCRLQSLFPNIPDRVISLALEVVDYRESMASHILENSAGGDKKCERNETNNNVSVPEDQLDSIIVDNSMDVDPCHSNVIIPPPLRPAALIPSPGPINREARKPTVITVCSSQSTQSKRPKGKITPKVSRGTCTAEDKNYKSSLVKSPQGPNPELPQGPQEKHILPGYVPWNGPNKDLLFGPSIKPNGPNRLLLGLKTIFARGPNKSLAKGPRLGLAKGSIYSQQQEPIHCH